MRELVMDTWATSDCPMKEADMCTFCEHYCGLKIDEARGRIIVLCGYNNNEKNTKKEKNGHMENGIAGNK